MANSDSLEAGRERFGEIVCQPRGRRRALRRKPIRELVRDHEDIVLGLLARYPASDLGPYDVLAAALFKDPLAIASRKSPCQPHTRTDLRLTVCLCKNDQGGRLARRRRVARFEISWRDRDVGAPWPWLQGHRRAICAEPRVVAEEMPLGLVEIRFHGPRQSPVKTKARRF